jgi:ribonuclease P protein component
MLSRRKRLRAQEVTAILAKGRSARASYLSMKCLPSQTSFRAVVMVPKSLARKAHDRNRLRRAVYRALANMSLSATKASVVFFVRNIPRESLTPLFAHDLVALTSKI